MQFVSHEEGRIRPKTIGNTANGFVYDYYILDHLQNMRMILTDQLDTSFYPAATLETATLGSDTTYYRNITSTRTNTKPAGYPTDPYIWQVQEAKPPPLKYKTAACYHHPSAGVLRKRKAVRRWNEAWICVLASSAGLVTTARTHMLHQKNLTLCPPFYLKKFV